MPILNHFIGSNVIDLSSMPTTIIEYHIITTKGYPYTHPYITLCLHKLAIFIPDFLRMSQILIESNKSIKAPIHFVFKIFHRGSVYDLRPEWHDSSWLLGAN